MASPLGFRRPPKRTDAELAKDNPVGFAIAVVDYLADVDKAVLPVVYERGVTLGPAEHIWTAARPEFRVGHLVSFRDNAALLADRTKAWGATHVIAELDGQRAMLASVASLCPVLVDEVAGAVATDRVLYLGTTGRASLLRPTAASGHVEQVVGVVLGSKLSGLVQAAVAIEHRIVIA